MSSESPSNVGSPHDKPTTSSIDLDTVFSPPTRDEWLTTALAGLPNHDSLDTLNKQTLEGLTIQVLYDAAESSLRKSNVSKVAAAGSWDNRLSVECGSDDASANKKILEGLNGGNSSVQIQMTATTNLSTVLNGVDLALAKVSLRSADSFAASADALLSITKEQAVDNQSLRCSFNADPIGGWLEGEIEKQPDQTSLKALAAFSKHISQKLPLAQTVLVDSTLHHNAGASTQQELVASIATAALYLEALLNEGLSLDQASQQIICQLSCDADVLMGVVKIRSLMGLWQHLLSEFAAASNTDINATDAQLNIVVETSKRYLSKQDYWNNHLRNIAACTAAALASAE